MWVSLAFMLGIILATIVQVKLIVWLCLLFGLLVFAFFESKVFPNIQFINYIKENCKVSLSVVLTSLVLGACYYLISQPDFNDQDLAFYNDSGNVTIEGHIKAYPDVRDQHVLLLIKVDQLLILETGKEEIIEPQGHILVRLARDREWKFGDLIAVQGEMITPPDYKSFSYQQYLARKGVYSFMMAREAEYLGHRDYFPRSMLYKLRDKAYKTINDLLPQPEAGLLAGILLGIERDISPGLEEDFQDTGIAHIVVISGFNIVIVAGLFRSLAERLFPKRWATWIAIIGICLYSILVGAQPPVVRAAIMGSLGLAAHRIGRRQTAANSLAFTAAVMCLFNTQILWSISFQLSFGATLGLILFADFLLEWFQIIVMKFISEEKTKILSTWVGEYFLFTIAAQLTTFPILAYHFQRFSLSSLLANILILPAQPLVMILGGLMTIAGMVLIPVGKILSWFAWPLLAYSIRMTEWMSSIPRGVVEFTSFPLWGVFICYGVMVIFVLRKHIPEWFMKSIRPGSILLSLFLTVCVIWQAIFTSPDGLLHFNILSFEKELAFFMTTPAGQRVLINGGHYPREVREFIGKRMPLWNRNLDLIILTDRKPSANAGMKDIFDQYPPEWIWHHAYGLEVFWDNPQFDNIQPGQKMLLSNDVELTILDDDPMHTALLISWGELNILIPGGVEIELLKNQSFEEISGVVLVLRKDDLQDSCPGRWFELSPQLVFYEQCDGVSENEYPVNWIESLEYEWLTLTSDGNKLWLEGKK